jgi:hypothetical protein
VSESGGVVEWTEREKQTQGGERDREGRKHREGVRNRRQQSAR